MPLAPSTRLGPYEIVSLVGTGGMGEVYRARDTRLNRTVAVKVVSEHLSCEDELSARFDREARAIANLSHPHICPLFDVGFDQGIRYLVMEFLQGQTLAERLLKGPLPLQEALRYAVEIAGALDHAHRLGVVHRDVKPGNVMLTDGGAKLLDFGIAKMCASPAPESTDSKTATLTRAGAIVGTFQYMAPEQLQGRDADARTDIFAFGAVVYEMITGRTAFDGGGNQAALIAAVLEHDPPPMRDFAKSVGAPVERTIRKALAKNPDDRWQTARDLKDELQWLLHESPTQTLAVEQPRTQRNIARSIAFLAAAVCGLAALFLYYRRPAATQRDIVRFSISLPEDAVFRTNETAGPTPQLAISPNGRTVAFVASKAGEVPVLWIRELDAFEAQRLPGTDDASFPFWSYDNRTIAFFATGKLKTINLDNRVTQVLANAPSGRGGTWNRTGTILFAENISSGLKRVQATGGAVTEATTLNRKLHENSHRYPNFLPDGRHFLYLALAPKGQLGLYAGSLDSMETTLNSPGQMGGGTRLRRSSFLRSRRKAHRRPFRRR